MKKNTKRGILAGVTLAAAAAGLAAGHQAITPSGNIPPSANEVAGSKHDYEATMANYLALAPDRSCGQTALRAVLQIGDIQSINETQIRSDVRNICPGGDSGLDKQSSAILSSLKATHTAQTTYNDEVSSFNQGVDAPGAPGNPLEWELGGIVLGGVIGIAASKLMIEMADNNSRKSYAS